MIDAALLRPGRFDRVVYVPLPDQDDRFKILQIHTKHASLSTNVDLKWVAAQTPMFSGAELENVCREAALLALRENIHMEEIDVRHFQQALLLTSPVSSEESLETFQRFHDKQGAHD
ncbi:hypothetical protein AaE_004078 [Aphanomyces astaci]|uniref:AAA ATPase AAA+ lid domain-containing protein n=1 Tax=Aphanomyces astaci TaxID=112090 RepID=A0A6A5ASC5_APHAT|nr:hypothetical protein AaE_004078 [Aphanomyces astaci]